MFSERAVAVNKPTMHRHAGKGKTQHMNARIGILQILHDNLWLGLWILELWLGFINKKIKPNSDIMGCLSIM